jgi:WD40 repeat protein
MLKKSIVLVMTSFLVFISIAFAEEKSSGREISEKLIVQIDNSSLIEKSLTASPDSKRVGYSAKADKKFFIVIDGKAEKQYDKVGLVQFSPDSKRVAYAAQAGNKQIVVVDGREEKQYDYNIDFGLSFSVPIFSPDSKRVAYRTGIGDKSFAVVDGKEGKQYDRVYFPIFSPDSKRMA